MEEIIMPHLDTCEWTQSAEDAFWKEYDTSCGRTISFDAQDDSLSEFVFCPYCSRRLRILTSENGQKE